MINFKDLEHVAAIARLGGIQKAAESVGLSQPALTKRIKALEERLKMKLFDRTSKGMRLTQAGNLFFEEGKKLTAHINDFESLLANYQKGKGGCISIGIKPGMDDAFFRAALIEFTQKYPATKILISIDTTPTLAAKIKSGDIDFAMGATGYADKHGGELVLTDDLDFEAYFRIPLEIIVRKDHPVIKENLNPIELFNYPLVCPTPPLEIWSNLKAAYKEKGILIDPPHILVEDYRIAYDLVEHSDMWTGGFISSYPRVERRNTLISLGKSNLLPPITIGLLKRKTWTITPDAKNLIEIMKRHAKKWAIT